MLKNGTLKNKSEGSYDIEGWASAIVRITTEGSYVTPFFSITSLYEAQSAKIVTEGNALAPDCLCRI
jgi:hypothetical protein